MSVVNDFQECLTRSHEASSLPIWHEIYSKAFPDMVGMHEHSDNGWWQQAGIDRSITLSTGKQIYVDEKIRGKNKVTGRVYEDVSLEYVSNDSTGAKGWVAKPLSCDYIAYAIAPLGIGYLFPVQQLQSAWRELGDQWIEEYGSRSARNRGYNTLFCPVPVKPLFAAIGKQLRVSFTPIDWTD